MLSNNINYLGEKYNPCHSFSNTSAIPFYLQAPLWRETWKGMWSCKRGSYWTSLHKSTASLSWTAVCNGDNAFRFLKQAQQVRFHLKNFICISKMSCNFFAFVCQNLLPIWFLIVTKQWKFAGVKWALGKHTGSSENSAFLNLQGRAPKVVTAFSLREEFKNVPYCIHRM